MASRLSALRTGRALRPRYVVSGTHFCYRLSKPKGLVHLVLLLLFLLLLLLLYDRHPDWIFDWPFLFSFSCPSLLSELFHRPSVAEILERAVVLCEGTLTMGELVRS
jgi:hypothetical protein